MIIICAYRFDTNISTEKFVEATEKLEEYIKEFIFTMKMTLIRQKKI